MVLENTPETTQASEAEKAKHTPKTPSPEPAKLDESADTDDLDFVVTEAHEQGTEMVGGFQPTPGDNLGIESPADLMQAEAGARKEEAFDRPSHDSYFAVPEPEIPQPATTPVEKPTASVPQSDAKAAEDARDKIERLSEEQIKEISHRMRAESKTSNYLSDDEKQQLMNAIGHGPSSDADVSVPVRGTGFATEPIVPPKRNKEFRPDAADLGLSGDSPRMSKRSRGVAYFAKGYIKVTGQQELHEGDEMLVAGREYTLQPKKFSINTIAIAITVAASIVVLILGMLFSSSADIGDGRVIGVVLGADGHPVLTGGEVRFPELGKTYEVNGQGFFKTDPLNAGSYQIQYVKEQTVLAQDYTTVADKNVTTVTLKPAASVPTSPTINSANSAGGTSPKSFEPIAGQTPPASSREAASNSAETKAASNSSFARLTLAASVDGAKLTLDGSVLGAGNLTYNRLKPGRHTYTVSKDGYQTVSGTVDLRTDKPASLALTLVPAVAERKPVVRPEVEYYQTAVSAIERNDLSSALTDLNKAVETNPNYAEAYSKRGEVYRALKNNPSAHDDYVRAAEIMRVRNDYGQALSAYAEALKADPKSVPALLGRGTLYLARNESLAAIADFDAVTRVDKKNLDAYIGLGRARYNQGTFDKAIKHFKDARSLDANNPVIHQYLMLSHYGAGEFKEAQKDYEKFIKCATPTQVQQMNDDPQFAAVMRVIEH